MGSMRVEVDGEGVDGVVQKGEVVVADERRRYVSR